MLKDIRKKQMKRCFMFMDRKTILKSQFFSTWSIGSMASNKNTTVILCIPINWFKSLYTEAKDLE